jgi:D-alanyl-lipoteichoic acid acyltransferase DltB (MBOAT superfamily)
MTLSHILGFSIIGLITNTVFQGRWRGRALFAASVIGVYWLQPVTSVRQLDFWLPTLTLCLVILTWIATLPGERHFIDDDISTLIGIVIIVILIAFFRYIFLNIFPALYPPPMLESVLFGLVILILVSALFIFLQRRGIQIAAAIGFIVLGMFIVLKVDTLNLWLSQLVRGMTGQSERLANLTDLRWLGFSYIALRLLHTIIDRRRDRLPHLSLQEYITYVVFFPTLSAGPIDRAERFVDDLRQPSPFSANHVVEGGRRITIGLFKKFILADSLAWMALNPTNAMQAISGSWLWIFVYAFGLQIYFDFSGYTDIAIGLGHLAGVSLPENFDRPYTQSNMAAFWNRWHITLAKWFRFYIFNPVTRTLRRGSIQLPNWMIIGIGQVLTMTLIGLWHGFTPNFFLWGLWHGLGLFIHNRWVAFLRNRKLALPNSTALRRVVNFVNLFVTFNYVMLGWVWFVMPTASTSLSVIMRMFGVSP